MTEGLSANALDLIGDFSAMPHYPRRYPRGDVG